MTAAAPTCRYAEDLTMRAARKQYFDDNGFGDTGGYDDAWVDFKLGPIPFPFPNTKPRVEAVKFHDLHHVLTGYRTDFPGELEISAWEIGAGCKGMTAAWVLNLGGMGAGLFRCPARSFRAFVRGRRSETLYGHALDAMLDETVGALRARFLRDDAPRASLADVALFALATALGLVAGLVTFALVLPLTPLGLVTSWLRKRSLAASRGATA